MKINCSKLTSLTLAILIIYIYIFYVVCPSTFDAAAQPVYSVLSLLAT